MKVRPLIALAGLAVLLLASCGGAPEPVEFTIEMSEYAFEPSMLEVEVGQMVTITLVNVGELDHEFMVGQVVATDDQGRPSGYRTDFFAHAGVTPMVTGGGMLMDHGDEHAMEEMDHGEEMDHMEGEGEMEEMEHADEHEEGEDMGEMEVMDVNMVMQPLGADPTTITFTVTEDMLGVWEFGCFEEDGVHYDGGMHGELVVRQ